mmetsp:Transcript_12479/g.25376  ORF Transcript_12479/g.25376 Transcript_12479/m.25376 type:complete len:369 (-) Transcript_12479:63-1169(-)
MLRLRGKLDGSLDQDKSCGSMGLMLCWSFPGLGLVEFRNVHRRRHWRGLAESEGDADGRARCRLVFNAAENGKGAFCVRYSTGFCKYGSRCPRVDQHRPDNPGAVFESQERWRKPERKHRVAVVGVEGTPNMQRQPYEYYCALALNGGVDGRWQPWEMGEREIMEMSAILIRPFSSDKGMEGTVQGLYEIARFHEFIVPSFYDTKNFRRKKERMEQIRMNETHSAVPFEKALEKLRFWLLANHQLYPPFDKGMDRQNVKFAFVVSDGRTFQQQVALQCRALGPRFTFPTVLQEWIDVRALFRSHHTSVGGEMDLDAALDFYGDSGESTDGVKPDAAERVARLLINLIADGAVARVTQRVVTQRNSRNP